LFLPKLNAVFREFGSLLAMLSWGIITPFNGALVRVTALPFQKKLKVFSPAKPAHRFSVSSQSFLLIKPVFVSAGDNHCGESGLHL
jgi:hypothetical protein